MNRLFYGDCLTVMRDMGLGAVDLIYLDPPFKSQRDYNAIYKDETGRPLPDQIEAFTDMWTLDEAREHSIRHMPVLMRENGIEDSVVEFWRIWMNALRKTNPSLLAYLSYMVERLVPMRAILKPTGSIYLHCDSTASHYIKVMMDGIFGHDNFRNEIVWRRTGSHGNPKRWAPIHDTILFYTKSAHYTWNWPKLPYMRGHVEENFVRDGDGFRTNYYGNVLTGSGTRRGLSGQTWRGIDPTAKDRHWAIPRKLWEESGIDGAGLNQHQKLDALFEAGLIRFEKGSAWPIYERRVRSDDGPAISNIWAYQPYTEGTVFGTEDGIDADVSWIKPRAAERMGYRTQKSLGLMGRIIGASSNPGDVVFDPFCGCATTLEAAHKLGRQWIGVDIAIHAIKRVAQVRLQDRLNLVEGKDFVVEGVPRDLEGARDLWERDKYHFQKWAVEQVDGFVTAKRTADGGIDGRLYFGLYRQKDLASMALEVKGGKHINIGVIRELRGVLERDEAEMAGLIVMEPVEGRKLTNFKREMAAAGHLEEYGFEYPRMQMLSVGEILNGARFSTPSVVGRRETAQGSLPYGTSSPQ
ncbi:MAG: site-specific DNA-methyltransferase [Rhodospirillales bacterium]|nr:site-specific DNA-methyltransferase [Rhodospirillales bacterium]